MVESNKYEKKSKNFPFLATMALDHVGEAVCKWTGSRVRMQL
jgi:hypothetical protein